MVSEMKEFIDKYMKYMEKMKIAYDDKDLEKIDFYSHKLKLYNNKIQQGGTNSKSKGAHSLIKKKIISPDCSDNNNKSESTSKTIPFKLYKFTL